MSIDLSTAIEGSWEHEAQARRENPGTFSLTFHCADGWSYYRDSAGTLRRCRTADRPESP